MGQHYDVIVIGGGHNGLVNAAYLAKAGKKVVVLERRHVLGGAAVTEEIIPGFLFSECSYVVSLLRPEIIRELDLPRHGLEILPLDGTFQPHAQRRLPLARQRSRQIHPRHSPPLPSRRRGLRRILEDDDADVPLREAHALHDSAGSHHAQSQRSQAASLSDAALPRTFFRRALHARAAHDHELRRFPRPVVRNRRPQSHHVRLRNYRHVSRHSFAGHRVRSLASLHGRNRRRVSLLGIQPRRHRSHFERHRRCGARSRRRDSHESTRRKNSRQKWPRRRRRPAERRRTLRQRRFFQRRSASHLREISRTQ